ncbi:GNAT family N-acetyltransferase [Halopseudomonas oceani]|uniref:GNAT family N-acetyltransferase n=1 Tax=Halopseudomonas oceani TaxID=1708783 RepID=UPI002AA7970F|nr:GNAT family N-acetyltransferase [Halopseudomonas oceani]
MALGDINSAAQVHRLAFVRQKLSAEWLTTTLNAYPRFLCYVAEVERRIVGYILWAQKSGFRDQVVLELDQIAVLPARHGEGIGRALIDRSLPLVKAALAQQGLTLKHIIVNTRADNHAQKLYSDALGAEVVATISDLYSADEVFMVARNSRL